MLDDWSQRQKLFYKRGAGEREQSELIACHWKKDPNKKKFFLHVKIPALTDHKRLFLRHGQRDKHISSVCHHQCPCVLEQTQTSLVIQAEQKSPKILVDTALVSCNLEK